ncbi:Uncharacterized protein YfgD, not an arsenate reductase [hydrothermal vent metagenome]|uniref:Uncharacterized protein YfgD, not an arsenate reductase n=1 Tax=hydrothermal vent metagenome TaxID=652676 RepID=A0A3B1BK42_9ZZZZ
MSNSNQNITIYHNPRCSKSRQTLELIADRNPTIIEYLKTPPTAAQLSKILDMLAMQPRDLMRKGESEYTEQKLDNSSFSRGALIAAMAEHPILIERPIVMANGKAAIGRPPEAVLEIL